MIDQNLLNWKIKNENKVIAVNDIDLSAVPLYFSHRSHVLSGKYDLRFLTNIKVFNVVSKAKFLSQLKIITRLIEDPVTTLVKADYINMYISCHESLYKFTKKIYFIQPFKLYKRTDEENSLFFLLKAEDEIAEGFINKILFTTTLFDKFIEHNKERIKI